MSIKVELLAESFDLVRSQKEYKERHEDHVPAQAAMEMIA